MAKDDHWFKFFYKLFIISTQGWKDDEVGAYIKLLINQFDRGALPDNEAELSKLITSYKKNWPMLSKKFKKCEDGFLRNDFMKDIRIERDEKIKSCSERGKTGGRPKNNLIESNRKANAFKNESDIYSPSLSDSLKEEGQEGENFLVPQMLQAFKQSNPKYLVDSNTDFPALLGIASKIKAWDSLNGWVSENHDYILNRWVELITHIKGDGHLSKYSISQISKHFQSITQSFNSSGNNNSKEKNQQLGGPELKILQ